MATEEDKVNNGALATLVAVGAFAMVGISLALVALVRDQVSIERSSKDDSQSAQYHALKKAQLAKLEGDTPIETEMASLVRELSANPHSATPPPRAGAAGAAGTPAPEGEGAAPAGGGGATPAPAGSEAAPQEPEKQPTGQKDGKLAPGGAATDPNAGSKLAAPPTLSAPAPGGAAPGSPNGK